MLTRLVPLFPFNLQNYAYGLTRIGFWPYAITSSICMLPGTAAFTFAGGALSEGRGDVRRTLGYLAVAGVLLVLVSLIPRWLQRRSRVAGDLLKAGVMAVLLDAFVLAARASAATAGEEAYARPWEAQVRPGTVHLVDYRAVRAIRDGRSCGIGLRTGKQWRKLSTMEKDLNTMKSALTVSQRVAICFAAGVIGAVAVVLFSHALFRLGLSATLGVTAPVSLKSPDIYKPLFWGGLWGLLFGLFIKTAWNRLYLVGFLYVLAPLLALFLFFLPMSGAGYFGLHQGPMFTVYLLLVNLPFGIVTALAARAIIGLKP
jgi:hypothetical protein